MGMHLECYWQLNLSPSVTLWDTAAGLVFQWRSPRYVFWLICIVLTHEKILDDSDFPLSPILLVSFYHDHIVDIEFILIFTGFS